MQPEMLKKARKSLSSHAFKNYQNLLFTGFSVTCFCDSCFELAEWKSKSGFQ